MKNAAIRPKTVTKVNFRMGSRLTRTRNGLMLAAVRVAMILLFGIWSWLDPSKPTFASAWADLLFATYLITALGAFAVAHRSWWFEHWLAAGTFVVDVLMFLTGLYATSAVTLDFFSVFITFFAFLVLTAASRWSDRTSLAVTVTLILCFLLDGLLLSGQGQVVDLPKFLRRLVYLTLLASLLIWFSRSRSERSAPRFSLGTSVESYDPLQEALAYAMAAFPAACGLVAWREDGELRPRVLVSGGTSLVVEAFDRQAAPYLFERDKGRRLTLNPSRTLVASTTAAPDPLIAAFSESEGLAIPFEGRTGHGQLLLGGITGLCSDDVFAAQAMAAEIGRAIDGESMQAMVREVAMSRLRAALAADLHDGVAQTLAGVQFRLKALGGWIAAGTATEGDVENISKGIATEQLHLRGMIDQLRRGAITPGRRDLRQELLPVAETLAEQWQVAIELSEHGEPLLLQVAAIYQIKQIVREAVANAVRHGHASRIEIDLSPDEEGGFVLNVCDNGCGCNPPGSGSPRSIAERVEALGGTMLFDSHPGGTSVGIKVPGAAP